MIIQKLTKLKDSTFEIEIEEKKYHFDEETILKYRLFEGSDISKKILEECLEHDSYEIIKKKAYSYHLKYLKNQYEVLHYLMERDVPYELARTAITELAEKKQFDDLHLCTLVAASLARNSNGPYLIKQKLKNRHFEERDISLSIQNISDEDWQEGREKLLKKALKKYDKLSSEFEKKQKVKQIFYRHGYAEV